MYLNQKIVTHFVKAKKPKTLQMYIQVGKCKKLHKATRNTLVGRGKKKSNRSEDIQKQTCNGNNFILRSGLHLNDTQFL